MSNSHKLTAKELAKLLADIPNEPSNSKLGRKHGVDHSTVYYYRNRNPIKQYHKPQPEPPPRKFDRPRFNRKPYREKDFDGTPPRNGKDYEDILAEDEQAKARRQANCEHAFWTKRCSCCNIILESDTGPNPHLIYKTIINT
ncbi:MAG: hypothetical protein M3P98_01485 [bacterium]|nr:hypothetical protein [bacterium]